MSQKVAERPAPGAGEKKGERKALRIGIIQDGRLVVERILRKPERVTVGKNPRNTFSLPFAFVPLSYAAFEVHGGRYFLRFVRGMDGTVAVGGEVVHLKDLVARKLAQPEGKAFLLPLSEDSRGKVFLGDVTLLYQFVSQRTAVPLYERVNAYYESWWARLDRPLAITFLLSLLLQAGAAGYGKYWWEMIGQYQEKDQQSGNERELIAVEFVPTEKTEEPTVALEPPEGAGGEGEGAFADAGEAAPTAEDLAEAKKPEKAAAGPSKAPQDAAARYQRDLKHVRSATILKFVDGGEGGPGARPLLVAGASGGDLASAAFGGDTGVVSFDPSAQRLYRGVPAAALATGGEGGGGYRKLSGTGGGGKYTGGIKTGKVETAAKGPELKVKVHVSGELGAKGVVGQPDKDSVASVFRRRRSAVRRCYEESLRTNPNVQGKVTIQFTIGAAGRITTISVTSDTTGDSSVAQCIVRHVKSWRFDPPERGSITFSYPFVLSRG